MAENPSDDKGFRCGLSRGLANPTGLHSLSARASSFTLLVQEPVSQPLCPPFTRSDLSPLLIQSADTDGANFRAKPGAQGTQWVSKWSRPSLNLVKERSERQTDTEPTDSSGYARSSAVREAWEREERMPVTGPSLGQ